MKARKLFKKVLSGSKNIRFDDFTKLLEALGFVLKRISGSHHLFKHPDVAELLSAQPSRSGQAKPYQVDQFLGLVEEYDLKLTDDETTEDW